MSLFSDLSERARALFYGEQQSREVDEELRFHLEREVQENVRKGMDPEQARRQALLAFGGVERVREETWEARGVRPVVDLTSDMRYAFRTLGRNRGFTLAAVAVLGLAIGASTVVFGVVNSVLLSELPYPHPERLVRIHQQNSPTNRFGLSAVDYQAIRDQARTLEAVGVVLMRDVSLSGAGRPEQARVGWATAGFFRALGVSPVRGRTLAPPDEEPGAPPVAVVSYAFAVQAFGDAAAAVGRSVTIDGVSHTVVGVLPRGTDRLAAARAAVWPVLQLEPPKRRGPFTLYGVGRLREGVSLEAAVRDLADISRRIFPTWASGFQDRTALLTPVPLRAAIVGNAGRHLGIFGGAVALVLLIAVANVATLMLVRASARERELAVRASLGATRSRLARLLVAESLVVATLAGLAGWVVATFGLRLVGVLDPNLPRLGEVALGGRALGFAAAAAAASGILVSLPAVSVVLASVASSLRSDDRRAGTSQRANLVRGALVVSEFALALPLLLGAGLLLNSFLRLQRVDPGFDPAGVVGVSVSLPAARYSDMATADRFWRQALERAQAAPGAVAAGLSTALPPNDALTGDVNNFDLVAHPAPAGAQPTSPWSGVTEGYFQALGVALLDGRLFTPADSSGAPPVVIVSRSWAEHYFPDQQAVGQEIVAGGCTECPPTTVIGVVGDVKYLGLAGSADAVYEPLAQYGSQAKAMNPQTVSLVVRSTAPPSAVFSAIREGLRALDPELPTVETTLSQRLQSSVADPRRWTAIVAGFAATAVLLAALGVFGLMSYVVRQRRREIGVRMALGAEPASVIRMIVGRGMRYALLGTGIGLGVALLQARWLRALLFEVAPTDPGTIAAVAALLLVVALAACWLPGRRAAHIRPLEALAAE
ncbi:MAG TPA: ABC transporter permease [Gemmatimonadota bacterium]|jgi:predicted permease